MSTFGKIIKKGFLLSLPFCMGMICQAVASTAETDESLVYMGAGADSTTEVMGYVEAVKEIPVADYEQLLLLNITYQPEDGCDVSSFNLLSDEEKDTRCGSISTAEKISNKIKLFTGFEGDITLDSQFDVTTLFADGMAKADLVPSEQLDKIMSYNQLMLVADEAASKSDIGTIYSVYADYNKGRYKEAVIDSIKHSFYTGKPVNYANSLVIKTDANLTDEGKVVVGKTATESLAEADPAFSDYQKYVIDSADGFGYAVTLSTVYGDVDLFPLFSSEYALFKYEGADIKSIDDMKAVFNDKLVKTGSASDRSDTTSRYNIFQSQALAGMFANSITIREIAQRYLNAKTDISALGTDASNGRSNWYALNVLTSGLVQILGWEAVLDATMIEYEGSLHIKGTDADK